jgi:hypothetical protein
VTNVMSATRWCYRSAEAPANNVTRLLPTVTPAEKMAKEEPFVDPAPT